MGLQPNQRSSSAVRRLAVAFGVLNVSAAALGFTAFVQLRHLFQGWAQVGALAGACCGLSFIFGYGLSVLLSYLVPILRIQLRVLRAELLRPRGGARAGAASAANHSYVLDLKRHYGAEWAVVTGSSSGMGEAIAEECAAQGINLVMAALDDAQFTRTEQRLRAQYPAVQIRAVRTDLARADRSYMKDIVDATRDIPVALFFSNAGYAVPRPFSNIPAEREIGNVECMVCAPTLLCTHFYQRMVNESIRGAIVITGSAMQFIPAAGVATYPPCKAYLAAFACSMCIEARRRGIDVVCLQPGFVATKLYDTIPNFQNRDFVLAKYGQTPRSVVVEMLAGMTEGMAVLDIGLPTVLVHVLCRAFHENIFVWLESFIPENEEFQNQSVRG